MYFYKLDCEEELNIYKKMLSPDVELNEEEKRLLSGGTHGDDIYFLFEWVLFVSSNGFRIEIFRFFFRFKKFPLRVSDNAARVRNAMCKLWTNFAKSGVPTPANQQFEFNWSPVKHVDDKSTYHLDYLNISSDGIEMRRNPEEERMKFWRKAFEKYNGGFLRAKL